MIMAGDISGNVNFAALGRKSEYLLSGGLTQVRKLPIYFANLPIRTSFPTVCLFSYTITTILSYHLLLMIFMVLNHEFNA